MLTKLELMLLVVVVVCRHIGGQRSVKTTLESSFVGKTRLLQDFTLSKVC